MGFSIQASSAESFKWVEDFFKEVPKDKMDGWGVVIAPISDDIGVVRVIPSQYLTGIYVVGELFDQVIKCSKEKKGIEMELRTVFKGKTIVWEIWTENVTLKICYLSFGQK